MLPQGLRAFRESLGLTRREFAPKLFISEPTLERWERGQGGPREIHLRILQKMRDAATAGESVTYFQYDAAQDALDAEFGNRQVICRALKSVGATLSSEEESSDGASWHLQFGLAWAVGEPADISLSCDGSNRAERPSIDFTLHVSCEPFDVDDHASRPRLHRRRIRSEAAVRFCSPVFRLRDLQYDAPAYPLHNPRECMRPGAHPSASYGPVVPARGSEELGVNG